MKPRTALNAAKLIKTGEAIELQTLGRFEFSRGYPGGRVNWKCEDRERCHIEPPERA